MYPYLFWWWNPIIYLPLSGPVTQDISPVVASRLSSMQRQMGTLTDALVSFTVAPRQTGERDRYAESLVASPLEIHALDAASKETRTEQTKALLKLLHSLDPAAFAQIVRDAAAQGEDKPAVPD